MNEEKKVTNAVTIFSFNSELGDDGYYTILASCEQRQSLDNGKTWVEGKDSVKILDRDANRGNVSAYNALLNILQAKNWSLLEEENNEQSGERYIN